MNRHKFLTEVSTKKQEMSEYLGIIENLQFLYDNWDDAEKVAGLDVMIKNQFYHFLEEPKDKIESFIIQTLDVAMQSRPGVRMLIISMKEVLQ